MEGRGNPSPLWWEPIGVTYTAFIYIKSEKRKEKKKVTPSIPTTFRRNKGKVDFARD